MSFSPTDRDLATRRPSGSLISGPRYTPSTKSLPPGHAAPFAAELHGVLEISLIGSADLDWWRERLAAERLEPSVEHGRARLMVSACAGRYARLAFREFIVAAFVPGGVWLAGALNSSRLLAWCERTFFSTPYRRAPVRVEPPPNAAIQAGDGVLEATLAFREPRERAAGLWEGAIHLPGGTTWFGARLLGWTLTWPFEPRDSFTLRPSPDHPELQALADSHFEPAQWSIRANATHARTKTFLRPTP